VYREQIRAKPARRGVLFADARREEGTMAGRGGERGREEGREGGEAKVAGGQEFIDLRRGQMHIDLCNSEITRSLERRTRGGGEGRERERERKKFINLMRYIKRRAAARVSFRAHHCACTPNENSAGREFSAGQLNYRELGR